MVHIIKPNTHATYALCGHRFESVSIDWLTIAQAKALHPEEHVRYRVCQACIDTMATDAAEDVMLAFDEDYACGMDENECIGAEQLDKAITLSDLRTRLKDAFCQWDNTPLVTEGEPLLINVYEHDYGWTVKGWPHKLWLSVKCPKCHYDWSISKLGVPREPSDGDEGNDNDE